MPDFNDTVEDRIERMGQTMTEQKIIDHADALCRVLLGADQPLSSCCGAPATGEIIDGEGRCSQCGEMANYD